MELSSNTHPLLSQRQLQRTDLTQILKVNWTFPDRTDPTWPTFDTDDITFHLLDSRAASPNAHYHKIAQSQLQDFDRISSNQFNVLATPNLIELINSQERGYLLVGKYSLGSDRCPIKYIQTRERRRSPFGIIPQEGYYDTNPNYEI